MYELIQIVIKRLAVGLLTLLVVSMLIFLGVEALPGDLTEAILGQDATPEAVAAFRKELKLDLPPHVRYLTWLKDFSCGDLGTSLANRQPISEMIGWRIRNSLLLAVSTAALAIPLSLILGMLAALHRNTWFDNVISMSSLSVISFPEFFVAYILVALLSVKLRLFPSICTLGIGMSLLDRFKEIFLPIITLTAVTMAHMLRMSRAAIINVLTNPYIEMAQLKGLNRRRIIVHHAFPNALSPVINVIVLNLAYRSVGVVVVEVVFVYPGLGQLMVDSVSKRDLPVVQACGLIFASTYVLLNLIADILAIVSNPRLRHPKSQGVGG